MKKRFYNRWIINLGLLAVIVLLLLVFPGKEEPADVVKRLHDFMSPGTITEVRIMRSGKYDIYFKFIDGHWHMLEPYDVRAESSLIKQVLSLTTLPVDILPDDAELNPADFGLQQPAISMQLNQHRINFGDNQPIGRRRYMELNRQIMLIPESYMSRIKASSVFYIDRHLIPQGEQLRVLRIHGEEIDLTQSVDRRAAWQSIKANWISRAPDVRVQQGIDVHIQLQDSHDELHYIARKRGVDIVLTNTQRKLEYHLAITAYDALGLDFNNMTNPAGRIENND